MKIEYKSKEHKMWMTVSEFEAVPEMLDSLKSDDGKLDFAYEINHAALLFDCYHVISATAEIGRNSRIFNQYTENSGHLDVWFRITAKDSEMYPRHFDEIYISLSDIWSIGADTENEIKSHCFHVKYSRDE